jgi:hypothetical protein
LLLTARGMRSTGAESTLLERFEPHQLNKAIVVPASPIDPSALATGAFTLETPRST